MEEKTIFYFLINDFEITTVKVFSELYVRSLSDFVTEFIAFL